MMPESRLRVHLYTTDISGLAFIDRIQDDVTAVIVPENRLSTEKVRLVSQSTSVPVFIQKRRQLPDTPPADAAIVWMYSQIFPSKLLKSYKHGMLNMHGGRIPDYRGASVLQWAIVQGETELGITWHQIVDEVDAGPIWAESAIPIGPHDTAWDVRSAMIEEGLKMFSAAWQRMLSRSSPVRTPDLSCGRIWPQRKAADGRFGPGLPELQIRNLVRALCPPWPPAVFITPEGREFSIAGIAEHAQQQSVDYPTAEGKILHLLVAAA